MENLSPQLPATNHCLNCGHPLQGKYCAVCGQEVKELRRPFFRLSKEALGSLFELDSRAYRTLFYLITKPAYLSREYFSGRRMTYTPPLRLFLVISVSFFLLASLYTSIQSFEGALNSTDSETVEIVAEEDDVGPILSDEDVTDIEDILEFVNQISLPFLTEQSNANLQVMLRSQAEANFAILLENPNEFARGYLEYITVFMLLMMPIMALIQKLFYFRTGHYYSEHLVLTLHNHAFIIIIFFLDSIAGMIAESALPIANTVFGFLSSSLYIWLWVYLYLSLKNYFQQGYRITLLKFLAGTSIYGFVLGLGVFVFSVILFFLG